MLFDLVGVIRHFDPEYVGGPEGDFLDLPPPPDAASSQAPETPDTRPLQERYAP